MSSLTECLAKAGNLIDADLKAAIHKRAGELRAEGMKPNEAAKAAISEQLQELKPRLQEVQTAMDEGATLYETAPATEGAKAEAEAAVSRVDQVLRDMPDLMVKTDDMEAPMKAADFMAMVKAEADELAADGPLMQIAAECFLLNGS